MVTVSLIVCIYYNVIMSYTVYYMVSSFSSEVPWSKCDPSWADMSTCYVRGSRAVSSTQLMHDLKTEFFRWLRHHVEPVHTLRTVSVLCLICRCCGENVHHIALCFISHVTGAWCPVGLLFDLVALMVFSGDNKPQSYSLCNFFSLPLVVSSLLDPNIILSTLSTNTFTLYYDRPSFTPVYFSRQNYSSVY